MMEVKDSLGTPIQEGDTVVYATRRRSETFLKNAVVCEIGKYLPPHKSKAYFYLKAINPQGLIVTLRNPHLRTAVVKKFGGEI
jgi:hypothetical protein